MTEKSTSLELSSPSVQPELMSASSLPMMTPPLGLTGEFTHAEKVALPCARFARSAGVPMVAKVEPLVDIPPSISPLAPRAPLFVPLFPLLVLSTRDNCVPLGTCHTAL